MALGEEILWRHMLMLKDRFTKFMLVAIALLLAGNMFRPGGSAPLLDVVPSAQAQTMLNPRDSESAPARRYEVKDVKGFAVEGLKEVVSLGDGKTFVVSNSKGFMVYTVETIR